MPTTRLAAIMFTDIVGYTAMMQQNRQVAMTAVKQFEAVLKNRIASHAGELLQTYGDGSLSMFDSASAAVQCAKEIQEEIRGQVPLRIGLHIGEITHDGDHTFGDGVNIASRIESMGVAGSVLMSGNIRQQIKNKPEFELEYLGKFSFKNVAEPVPLYGLSHAGFSIPKPKEMQGKGELLPEKRHRNHRGLIRGMLMGFIGLLIGVGLWMNISWGGADETVADISQTPSVAVMPFLDFSPKKNQAFLGDGMAEEVINILAQESDLKVSSRSSSFSFKQQDVDVSTIADKLGVDHILEGSVREYKGKIKISVQLIDAKLDKSIWAKNWEEELGDVFGVQENIANEVLQALKLNLVEARKWQIEETQADAYRLFLQAKHQFTTESNARKARELILRSIKLDSSYAPAWILLGEIDLDFAGRGSSPTGLRDFVQLYELAKTHALRGIQLGPNAGYGYASLASIYGQMFGKQDSAIYYAERALQLAPGDTRVLSIVGLLTCFNYEFEKGLTLLDKAESLDPLSAATFNAKALGNYLAQRFDIAEANIRKWLQIQPKTGMANYLMAMCLIEQGRPEEAKMYADQEKLGGFKRCAQAVVARKQEDIHAADTYLTNLIKGGSVCCAYQISEVYGYREDADKAFEWLERSYAQYDPGTHFAPFSPAFSFMHKDPRWEAFVQKVQNL